MKNIQIAILAVAVLPLASCHKKEKPQQQTPEIEVADVLVKPVLVHKTYPAYLTANEQADLVARVNGYLVEDMNYGGKFVKKGTVLYRIQSDQYVDAVNQAEAQLRNARAAYEYAQSNYSAMQKALQSDAVSQMEVLQAKSTLDRCRGDIKNAEAALSDARTTLSYCTIRAPFDGRVTTAAYDTGSYLAGAGSPVVISTIYKDDNMNVNFSMDDKSFAEMQEKMADPAFAKNMQNIPLLFDVPLEHTYTASYKYASPAVDRETGTVRMQVTTKNDGGELRSGMYCKVEMPEQEVQNAILVRDASIGTDQLGKFVYTVNDKNEVGLAHIQVGDVYQDTLRIVTKGLKPGDRYVTKALLKVREGMEIKPVLTK